MLFALCSMPTRILSIHRYKRVTELLKRRQSDLTVVLEGVQKGHNLAAITRTCDAVGILQMHALMPSRIKRRRRPSGGSHKWVQLYTYDSMREIIERLRQDKFQILVAHQDNEARCYLDIDYTRPTALVFGTELFGVSPQTIDMADQKLYIPMMGMVESLNVSVAAGVILYETRRQRERAGLYEQPRLDNKTIERLTFEMMYPRVAEYYKSQNKPYPLLDEHGHMITGA
ncbi:tRNA (guanosine(18)-2'-O)-methyltransferase TrmH [candidate division KSB1 bacterium]|nr:tRNA (guanosine(18)-2'-O)-methyltransferase TrmH [candidate division KSB1 bacterium]